MPAPLPYTLVQLNYIEKRRKMSDQKNEQAGLVLTMQYVNCEAVFLKPYFLILKILKNLKVGFKKLSQ